MTNLVRILVHLVLIEIISRFHATLSAISCICVWSPFRTSTSLLRGLIRHAIQSADTQSKRSEQLLPFTYTFLYFAYLRLFCEGSSDLSFRVQIGHCWCPHALEQDTTNPKELLPFTYTFSTHIHLSEFCISMSLLSRLTRHAIHCANTQSKGPEELLPFTYIFLNFVYVCLFRQDSPDMRFRVRIGHQLKCNPKDQNNFSHKTSPLPLYSPPHASTFVVGLVLVLHV